MHSCEDKEKESQKKADSVVERLCVGVSYIQTCLIGNNEYKLNIRWFLSYDLPTTSLTMLNGSLVKVSED
jgi:hypothetical protein